MARSSLPRNSELSTSRISRLLRPLRTKCIALAIFPSTPCATTSTYGSKACSVEYCPLDILPPPDSVRSYHVDHRSVAGLRAALYAVRNCFQEIVIKTKQLQASGAPQRIPRLADLCSTIVGENIEGEDNLAADGEDLEQLTEVESIYEVIPVQYRRSALLTHSLDIILRCPHHFTLLSILLDVSLQHNLYHESCVLLHRLLQAAVSPASETGSARLCHPAHSNYLIDLCRKWSDTHPTSVLIGILTTVLVETARPELWCCKALAKFTRELHNQDFQSLIHMASQLVTSVAEVRSKRRTFGIEESFLTNQLNKWLNYSSSFPPSEDSTLILEFLEQCRRSGVHQKTSESESLAATVVCWATHYLPVAMPGADTSIYRLLKDVSPSVTIYNLLVEKSFIKETTVKLQDTRLLLQRYARCLRAKNLLLLEASLWACTLRFVEVSTERFGPCSSRQEVSLYREELMELVDDAERRCFGSSVRSVGSSPCRQVRWEWEESMGCWIQCDLPPAKKAKHYHELGKPSATRSRRLSTKPQCVALPLAAADNGSVSTFELSFTSLVSSAISNRTKLHGHSDYAQLWRPPARTLLLPPEDIIPASEDALDLFAYTNSSP
ncbi:hypothetical protein B0H19DRAFT_31626 [Mycena capillaripes]|nr:hypothetical protein B0H19DRAFT_31626 [Mycena capillaripes]